MVVSLGIVGGEGRTDCSMVKRVVPSSWRGTKTAYFWTEGLVDSRWEMERRLSATWGRLAGLNKRGEGTYDVAGLGGGVGDVADDEDVGEGEGHEGVEDEEGELGREHLGGGTGSRTARHGVEAVLTCVESTRHLILADSIPNWH